MAEELIGIETNALTEVQLKSVQDDLGITEAYNKVIAEQERAEGIENEIKSYIPDETSESNQLADKNFVNSSISTATAYFRGTFNSVAELEAYSGEKTLNDYAFVVGSDSAGNVVYNRYKYNGSAWVFEYTLNNSSFTSEQWAAIQSGITAELVANIPTEAPAVIDDTSTANNRAWSAEKINAHTSSTSNPHEVTKAQVGLGSVLNRGFDSSLSNSSSNHLPNKTITANCNGIICNTAVGTAAKTVTIEGFTLFSGAVVRVLFTHGNSAANPTLNVSSKGAKNIKVVKAGSKIAPPVLSGKWRGGSSYTNETWQPLTLLELMYDGTDWIIMGNPEVENYSDANGGYSVKANGLIEQWKKVTSSDNEQQNNFDIKFLSSVGVTAHGQSNTEDTGWNLNFIVRVFSVEKTYFKSQTLRQSGPTMVRDNSPFFYIARGY